MSVGMESQASMPLSGAGTATAGRFLPLVASRALVAAALALTVETFILISVGGMVRNAGAGLSCPDWPLCFGRVVPPMDYQVFLEWFHRLMAGTISALLLTVSAFIFAKPVLRRRLGWHCALAVGLLLGQIVLGGLTVLGLLDPAWVSSHLLFALAFFGAMLLLTLRLVDADVPRPASRALGGLQAAALTVSVILFGQIFLGGLVSSNYAGLACPDFPTCHGQWLPALDGLVRFQFWHRVGAVVATAALSVFTFAAWTRIPEGRGRLALRALPWLLGMQLFFGIGSVLWHLPLPMSVAHLATATSLWAVMLVVNYEIQRFR